MKALCFPLFLGAWCWLGIFAAAGHAWAHGAFFCCLLGFVAYLVAVVLSGGEK